MRLQYCPTPTTHQIKCSDDFNSRKRIAFNYHDTRPKQFLYFMKLVPEFKWIARIHKSEPSQLTNPGWHNVIKTPICETGKSIALINVIGPQYHKVQHVEQTSIKPSFTIWIIVSILYNAFISTVQCARFGPSFTPANLEIPSSYKQTNCFLHSSCISCCKSGFS